MQARTQVERKDGNLEIVLKICNAIILEEARKREMWAEAVLDIEDHDLRIRFNEFIWLEMLE